MTNDPSGAEDWELLAVLLGKGTRNKDVEKLAREILYITRGLNGFLRTGVSQLEGIHGLGRAKIASLVAAREIAARISLNLPANNSESFTDSLEKFSKKILLQTAHDVRESFFLATFTVDKRPIKLRKLASGSLLEVGVHTRDLVKYILDDGAGTAVIAHNHPHAVCQPSRDDIHLYTHLKKYLVNLEVDLYDQLVFGIDGIYSCRENKKIHWQNENPSANIMESC